MVPRVVPVKRLQREGRPKGRKVEECEDHPEMLAGGPIVHTLPFLPVGRYPPGDVVQSCL